MSDVREVDIKKVNNGFIVNVYESGRDLATYVIKSELQLYRTIKDLFPKSENTNEVE